MVEFDSPLALLEKPEESGVLRSMVEATGSGNAVYLRRLAQRAANKNMAASTV